MESRYQQHGSREARHHHYGHQHQEQATAGENAEESNDRNLVKSTTTSSCSRTYDVSDDVKSDVISPLRHCWSPTASRPVYIHRPFEDVPAPLQLHDARRLLGADDRGRAALMEEPRHGWLAHGHYQLGSVDGGSESWRLRRLEATSAVLDDEVGSSGDSVCCDDDDVTDAQVRVAKATDSQAPQRHDVNVISHITDDDTASPSDASSQSHHHYQPQHCRKPGTSRICRTRMQRLL